MPNVSDSFRSFTYRGRGVRPASPLVQFADAWHAAQADKAKRTPLRSGGKFVSRDTLLRERDSLIARFPELDERKGN